MGKIVLGILVCAAFAACLYAVKYQVQALDEELVQTRRAIIEERKALHVLQAEWAYLNRPERLAKLAGRHLPVAETDSRQFAVMDDVPYTLQHAQRAAPAGTQVAANYEW